MPIFFLRTRQSSKSPQNRDRKLLLHRKQINTLIEQLERHGLIAVPTKLYLKKRRIKIEIGIGSSKNNLISVPASKIENLNDRLIDPSKIAPFSVCRNPRGPQFPRP